MRALVTIILITLSSCNLYDLVGDKTTLSDDFEDLLSAPKITISPSKVSVTEINSAGTTGIQVKFSISSAQFNDFTTTGEVDDVTMFSIDGPGSVSNIELPTFAQKSGAQNFEIIIKNNGTNSVLTGEAFIKVEIPTSAYTPTNSQDLERLSYFIELTP